MGTAPRVASSLALVSIIVVVTAHCGGAAGTPRVVNPDAGTGSGGGPPDGSVGSGDAGGGGSTDAGGGGSTDAGGGGSVDAGGSGSADAGSGDASSGGESGGADAGQDRGVADECDGIVPASVPAAQFANAAYTYVGGSDDLIGRVALGRLESNSSFNGVWDLYPTDRGDRPAPVATVSGYLMWPSGCQMSLQSQPQGFSGVDCSNNARELRTWDHDGRIEHSYAVDNGADSGEAYFAIDPSGGTVALHAFARNGIWSLFYQRYDKHGFLETQGNDDGVFVASGSQHAGMSPTPRVAGLGVNLAGRTLFFFEDQARHGTLMGMWLERDGTHHEAFDTTVRPQNTGIMQFLPDGRLALREDGWRWAWRDLATTPDPVPDWLRLPEHRHWEFFTIRGGRGFAVGNSNVNGVDLYSAGGKLCGHLDVPIFGDSWAVGRDGTLMVGRDPNGQNSHWWPQLLK